MRAPTMEMMASADKAIGEGLQILELGSRFQEEKSELK
jgi:hypothetical protein